MPKVVFVAHAISGDIVDNIKKVLVIAEALHRKGVIPIFPSYLWRQYLEDTPQDKKLAGLVNSELFRRKAFDELWIYGPKLSVGIKDEVALADLNSIPVVLKAIALKEEFALFRAQMPPPFT